jgi:hypothetical protein
VGDEIFGCIPKRSTGRILQNGISFQVILVNSNGEIQVIQPGFGRRYSIKLSLNTRRFITTSSGPKRGGAVPLFLGSGDGNPSWRNNAESCATLQGS